MIVLSPQPPTQLGGHLPCNRPATPLASPSCAPGRVLCFCNEPTERIRNDGQGKAHHSPEQPKLRRHGDDFQWWQAPSTMRHGNECANLNSLGAWSHWMSLAPLQGATTGLRCVRLMNPGHRCAQPWARVFRPVGPKQDVLKTDRGCEGVIVRLVGPMQRVMETDRGFVGVVSWPVGPMVCVPNGDRDSSPGLRKPRRPMPWERNVQTTPISSRPEGAREACIHP